MVRTRTSGSRNAVSIGPAARETVTLGADDAGELSGCGCYRPSPAQVSVDRILRIQGYGDPGRVRPAIREAAALAARWAHDLCAPEVCYRKVPVVSCRDGVLRLAGDEGDVVFRCEAFPRFLGGCSDAVAFVLTVGPQIDQKVIELTESGEGLLEALLLETAGWLCVEDATRQFRGFLRQEAESRGLRLTPRMGPGYSYKLGSTECMWNLEEQRSLFALFGAMELPVRLLESCAMLPKISRSGLIGLAPARNGGGGWQELS